MLRRQTADSGQNPQSPRLPRLVFIFSSSCCSSSLRVGPLATVPFGDCRPVPTAAAGGALFSSRAAARAARIAASSSAARDALADGAALGFEATCAPCSTDLVTGLRQPPLPPAGGCERRVCFEASAVCCLNFCSNMSRSVAAPPRDCPSTSPMFVDDKLLVMRAGTAMPQSAAVVGRPIATGFQAVSFAGISFTTGAATGRDSDQVAGIVLSTAETDVVLKSAS